MSRITPLPVDLDRSFVPIRPDEPITSENVEGHWFRHRGDLSWADLLKRPRVVILAEANSGKTFEFGHQVAQLRTAGKSAFFAPIEQLAERNLEAVLGLDWPLFEAWQASGQPGWFFLDSVDEAKLTHRNLELAFKQFARDLAGGYQRARILVSCRGTDWEGESDLKRISTALPAVHTPASAADSEDALLARVSRKGKAKAPTEPPPPAYSVVSMMAFSADQRRRFLDGAQVTNMSGFEAALAQHGLLGLADRPGDLLVLAEYWNSNSRLGGLTEMMEFSIGTRVADRRNRPDAGILSDRKAREGAERIAAAMVLGRAMTVKTDLRASGSGVRLAAILEDWTPVEQDSLIRRGVFAAATYGQARFNHRSVMEYLAGRWFIRALDGGCPVSRVMAVATAKPFGIDTIPPSLRPTAAWLAPHCPPLRRFITDHSPVTLFLHGDPAALAVADRAALLRRYAELHRHGRLRQDYADEHALWMFADPALEPTITAIWPDADDDFRFELLRLIEQGGLAGCAKLAAEAALDEKAGAYTRILAARVLAKIDQTAALKRLANQMLAAPDRFSARLGPQLATVLFPKALTLKSLLTLMDQSPSARRYEVEGFGYVLGALYAACASPTQKRDFIDGVAALCRQPPQKEPWEPVSKRHAPIARRVEELLAAALKDVPLLGVWPGLVALAWVAQAADLDSDRERQAEILQAVRRHVALNEALFWFGVDRMVEQELAVDPVRLWHWQHLERRYWTIRDDDRGWLEAAASGAQDPMRRRIAFAALIRLAEAAQGTAEGFPDLNRRYAGDPLLMADLLSYLEPRLDPPEIVEHGARYRAREQAAAEAEALSHQAWRELRDQITAHPGRLQDEALFQKWPHYRPLVSLTNWLAYGAEQDKSEAILTYPDLAQAFSPEVAAAYRTGMVRFWRVAKPKPPKRHPDGRRTTPWSSVLAMAGLALDAATTPSWIGTLSSKDARLAVRHAFTSGMDFPNWLDALLTAFPHVVEPYVVRELKREWTSAWPAYTPLLYRCAASLPLTPGIHCALLSLIEVEAPTAPERHDQIRQLLSRLTLSSVRRRALARTMTDRLEACVAGDDWEAAMGLMPILFVLDAPGATAALRRLLEAQPQSQTRERAEGAIGTLFGMARGKVWGLRALPEDVLAELLRLTYRYVRPEDDNHHDGSYTPNRRDDAETGRNELLGALMNKGGERAYLLMRQLLAEKAFGQSTQRLHRLGQEMAEAASEGRAWDEAMILRFESEFTEPVTSGERLFALVCELIDDISQVLQSGDVSARELLLTARDEHAVQSWLARELEVQGRGRFTVPIEKEAPARDRLDITVVSNAAQAEVAVEMKHGDMQWTLPRLRVALSGQLAERYLKPARRRHGVFVISNHGFRRWSDGAGGWFDFAGLIGTLQSEAEGLVANRFGPIHVAVRGLDAVLPGEATRVKTERANNSKVAPPRAARRARKKSRGPARQSANAT